MEKFGDSYYNDRVRYIGESFNKESIKKYDCVVLSFNQGYPLRIALECNHIKVLGTPHYLFNNNECEIRICNNGENIPIIYDFYKVSKRDQLGIYNLLKVIRFCRTNGYKKILIDVEDLFDALDLIDYCCLLADDYDLYIDVGYMNYQRLG